MRSQGLRTGALEQQPTGKRIRYGTKSRLLCMSVKVSMTLPFPPASFLIETDHIISFYHDNFQLFSSPRSPCIFYPRNWPNFSWSHPLISSWNFYLTFKLSFGVTLFCKSFSDNLGKKMQILFKFVYKIFPLKTKLLLQQFKLQPQRKIPPPTEKNIKWEIK